MACLQLHGSGTASSQKIGHVHRHFIDLSRVVHYGSIRQLLWQCLQDLLLTFDVSQDPHIFARHEVDSDTLAPEASRPTNPVDVVLSVARQIVVDNQTDLLHIDTARPHVRADQHSAIALSELAHDRVAFLLGHFTVHAGDREVRITHLVREPVDLAARVAENDCLRDGECIIQIAEGVELPLFLFDRDKVLFQSLEGQLVTLDKDPDGIGHELGCHVEDIVWERGAHNNNLRGWRQVAVDVVDLLAESSVEEFVGFVQDKHLDVAGAEVATTDHIGNTARRSRDDVLAIVELADVLADVGAANAGMALHVHVITKRKQHGLDLGRQFASWG